VSLRLLHRRLAVLLGLAGLLAFAGGAGLEPVSALLALTALAVALVWQPGPRFSARLERVWLPLAGLLVLRALLHVFVIRDDVVIPVVDLLLLLMAAEALRSLDAPNDVRLYALSFALLLAATAYRPGILFLVAFVAYVMLATFALLIGHLRRAAARHAVRDVPLDRHLLRTTFGLSGVILIMAGAVFLTFPRVSRGWAGRGESPATSIAGFSDQVSIGEHGSRIYPNPQIVLRVEFPQGVPNDFLSFRWRGRSYDRFDGIRWSRTRGLPPSSAPTDWYRSRWRGPILEQRIYGAPLDARVLFALHPIVRIDPAPGIQPLFDNAGDFVYWGSVPPSYTAFSRRAPPAPEELTAAESGYRPQARYFLQLPDLDPSIRTLSDSLTAGETTRYGKVRAIQRWLQSFEYTLELPATAREATLEHFLFRRRAGHCEYFSTAMVVLLRSVGVEARNVNGFLGGEWSQLGDYLAVTQNQAHSWVEVWFPGLGWVTFDPTPGGGGVGTRRASWLWPGRILFDAIQHRWSKWVLDYDIDAQSGLFQRWRQALGPDAPRDAGGRSGRGGRRSLLWLGLLSAAVLGGVRWARRLGPTLPPESRAYLSLRDLCRQAGVPVTPGLTPLALVDSVREHRSESARAAERVVDLYLRARYGGRRLGESERRELQEALRTVRRTLKGPAGHGPVNTQATHVTC
jgi:transglutaminase-like putative cysteine protease